jgi:hypothetical protein
MAYNNNRYEDQERDFASYLTGKITFSSPAEDMYEHWDVKQDDKYTYDVKSLKKRQMRDDSPDELLHWVEMKNVKGNKGWLFGKADYFAFETFDFWIVVSNKNLNQLMKDKLIKTQTLKPELYKLYRRNNRKDIVTMVKTLDLFYYAERVYKKNSTERVELKSYTN